MLTLHITAKRTINVASLEEASVAMNHRVVGHGMEARPSSAFPYERFGHVTDESGTLIARVSYNGRVWSPEPYPQCKVLIESQSCKHLHVKTFEEIMAEDDAANEAAGVGDLDALPFHLTRTEPHEHVARSSEGKPRCYVCSMLMDRVGERRAWEGKK